MGLDMYLSKKIYVSSENRGKLKITGIKSKVRAGKVNYIIEEAGYWRKANAIHKWFVDNVQKGVDDCAEYYVSSEQLKDLLTLVDTVLKASKLVKGKIKSGEGWTKEKGHHDIIEDGEYIEDPTIAKKLLPCQSGFFFGGTAYDQYYYNDLVLTKTILEKALEESEGEFTYNSSW
jgi:hypothetical protein